MFFPVRSRCLCIPRHHERCFPAERGRRESRLASSFVLSKGLCRSSGRNRNTSYRLRRGLTKYGEHPGATVNFIRREKSRGRAGANFWIDVGIVARTISYTSAAHLLEVGLWALLFVICGEFPAFGTLRTAAQLPEGDARSGIKSFVTEQPSSTAQFR